MRLRLFLCLIVTFGALAPACAASTFGPRTVRDSRRVAIAVKSPPRRIISLAPGATEMLYALGLGPCIVGDTTYCNYPKEAQSVAKIGDVTTNIEKVLSLRPDLIVATDANKEAAAHLTRLHQPVFVIAPTSFDATEQSIILLGNVTGAEAKAKAIVAQMEHKKRFAKSLAARDHGRRPRVLVVVGLSPLWTAGSGTFINDVIRIAGGVNIASSISQYAPYSKEAVIAHPPDIIMADHADAAAMGRDPLFRTLAAVRNHRFFSVNSDIIDRPGPRLADALAQVARALHQEAR